ncbi:GDP-fucose synthetase [Candidatus Uhrbacteria bacterium RIFCSPHIGHO2_12_FULL_47_12]|uniref:GDP-L-fucose synthase n=1 Tax=Candidatus Uhrbacteria bacterium RIFCSPLOWO2_02_FULL_48_18 TaxID=1802408 RepID=A0A1F7VAA2_9BACT|nr:MAG: GDP-fucose synthetase [Candidatus Uhrbacteria bacterium RIFCSPHIGHO2_01_FULL_47_10]OGL77199.1 MAG: GDP-fucose synthetase [Candidatus Uhrbacteria bacterium RIFCSPHIGHO2_12_FULL_47_12]OGL81865.1 MAG: GDP-fucose synthetase [Candidatus Uhrbacteria bacterium RIFCSPLOWO2_01_FULL_47_17]OGL87028.1 MAG: GDP-fucose synthetase [Candidatus Uhrbacteria bacterium RIFCSPLOWO2_02_FULL_48_18]OGL91678.1 MAG: GDP-fucose synthetase [Candidatus Uhrbacteria bacterium RIFCSPLOWO2_12_FULL_47_9]
MLDVQTKIFVAGHRGLVGSALVRALERNGHMNIIVRTRSELDLMDPEAVQFFFQTEKPQVVIDAAAKVGGIMANIQAPADFIFQNLQIQNNLIHGAYKNGVKKFVFLGSSCIYPRLSQQPMKEEYFMTGPLEPTNEAYAIAKIAGINMCQSYNKQYGTDFISLMPTNIYGFQDNFSLETGHALQAMMHRFHKAKMEQVPFITLWGSGEVYREFMFSDDAADAILFLANNYSGSEIVNIGTGVDVQIKELAEIIKRVVGYQGEIQWDLTKPEGMPRKLMDVQKLNNLGWKHTRSLEEGIIQTYKWFLENAACNVSVN